MLSSISFVRPYILFPSPFVAGVAVAPDDGGTTATNYPIRTPSFFDIDGNCSAAFFLDDGGSGRSTIDSDGECDDVIVIVALLIKG